MIVLAAVIMALYINIFVQAGDLFPGGVSGVAVLIQRVLKTFFGIDVHYSVLNIVLNIFPIWLGYRYVGKKFTLYSVTIVILSSLLTEVIPQVTVTEDMLLICVFGGILAALAAGIALRNNACGGGSDFVAVYLLQEKHLNNAYDLILCFNVGLLVVAGVLFGWERALYSIIFQYTANQALHLFYKKYLKETLLVVTDHPDEVAGAIYDCSGHGATILHGEGSYGHHKKDVVYSIISRAENRAVLDRIRETDPEAFINELLTQDMRGNFYIRKEE
jgi:uncharacterized membrane-anchored protein YitT (DUF2179 family)